MLDAIASIGRDRRSGGYRRFVWSDADLELREWFASEAQSRGLDVVEDGNGNQLAWWGSGGNALLIGSHLDSVPDGGAFDGPLGVVSAFAVVDRLQAEGFTPARPLVIGNFADEEGARFGIACAGSRLATGGLEPHRALALKDRDGVTLAEELLRRGRDPRAVGRSDWLDSVGSFVELHVEQGRGLVHADAPVGVASAIWPHGRWRMDFCGEANHAGTTAMGDRRDPMPAYAATVLAARRLALQSDDARVTFGRVEVDPGGTNAVPSKVSAWLDARASDEGMLDRLVAEIGEHAQQSAVEGGTTVQVTAESMSPAVQFDADLSDRMARMLDAPVLPTAAGHDAGVLSQHVPTAMLFVRNRTGVSHSPDEFADEADCLAGVDALARIVERELS